MSIRELHKLVPPPEKPFEVETITLWRKAEAMIGLKLPRDYRDFVFSYGSGLFAGFYRVYNPFAASEWTSLISQVQMVCKNDRSSQQSFPDRFPYPYYPEPGGLLPWGNDENGNDYFWLTKGPPTKWQVAQNEGRERGFKIQPFSMTGFLVAVLERKVKALAGGYPHKKHLKFEGWDSSEM
jgi:hypothetical protein